MAVVAVAAAAAEAPSAREVQAAWDMGGWRGRRGGEVPVPVAADADEVSRDADKDDDDGSALAPNRCCLREGEEKCSPSLLSSPHERERDRDRRGRFRDADATGDEDEGPATAAVAADAPAASPPSWRISTSLFSRGDDGVIAAI